jgi:uncharacterized protein (TIGR03067 family)
MNTRNLLTTCGLTILLAAGIVSCGKPKAGQASLEGRWSGFEQGRPDNKLTLTLNGDRFAYWNTQSNEWGRGTFVVNDTLQPAQMDLTFQECPAPQYMGKVALAIYELQRDELKFAGSEPGSTQRPTNIAGGQGVRTLTFKRE